MNRAFAAKIFKKILPWYYCCLKKRAFLFPSSWKYNSRLEITTLLLADDHSGSRIAGRIAHIGEEEIAEK